MPLFDTENKLRATVDTLPIEVDSEGYLTKGSLAAALGYWYFIDPFIPTYQESDIKVLGSWKIEQWANNKKSASIGLQDLKILADTELPKEVFRSTIYPNADIEIIGKYIPIIYGSVRGAECYQVNTTTNRFKFANHTVLAVTNIYDGDKNSITPDSIDLVNGELIWTGWTDETLYVDVVAANDNAIDVIKLLFTDTTRGANIPLTLFDTTSTGNLGFGTNGARNELIYGHDFLTGAEKTEFSIGLYLKEKKSVLDWVQMVAVASFVTVYIDTSGKYQCTTWKPVCSEGLPVITKDSIVSGTNVIKHVRTNDIVTKARALYNKNHAFNSFDVSEIENNNILDLRGLSEHKTLSKELCLADSFSAEYWAWRTVWMREDPRIIFSVNATQEYQLLTPGSYVVLNDSETNIDTVCEVIDVGFNPAKIETNLVLSNVRNFNDSPGFWVEDTIYFPASLGGGAITAYSHTWTDEQKKWYFRNSGTWTDDNDYIDSANDPLLSFLKSAWV